MINEQNEPYISQLYTNKYIFQFSIFSHRRWRARRRVWRPSSSGGPLCVSKTSGAAPLFTWPPPVAVWGSWGPCCRPPPPTPSLSHTSLTTRATHLCTGPATTVHSGTHWRNITVLYEATAGVFTSVPLFVSQSVV